MYFIYHVRFVSALSLSSTFLHSNFLFLEYKEKKITSDDGEMHLEFLIPWELCIFPFFINRSISVFNIEMP